MSRLNNIIKTRFSDEDLERLDTKAKALGLNRSDLIRHETLGAGAALKLPNTDAQMKTANLLLKIGNNLNQAQKQVNTAAKAVNLSVDDLQYLHDQIIVTRDAINQMRSDILKS